MEMKTRGAKCLMKKWQETFGTWRFVVTFMAAQMRFLLARQRERDPYFSYDSKAVLHVDSCDMHMPGGPYLPYVMGHPTAASGAMPLFSLHPACLFE